MGKRLLVVLIMLLGAAGAQVSSHTAFRIRFGAALPATCSPNTGDVFFKTTATIGAYQCLTTNSYTAMGGSAFASGGLTVNVLPKSNGAGQLADSSIIDSVTNVATAEPWNLTAAASTTVAIIQLGATNKGLFFESANTIGLGQDTTANWFQVSSAANSSFGVAASGCMGWSSSNTMGSAANDTCLFRDGTAGFVALKGSGGTAVAGFRIFGTNGAFVEYGTTTESLTIAAAATTDSVGNLLPANSIIDAVDVRVTTVIPTAATFTVGDATVAARFATGVAVAANTTAVGDLQADQTGTSGPRQVAAAKVRITPNLSPGAATGVVRLTVHYHSFTPPTS